MVCRLQSTSVIVNNIIFESDSSYVNVQRSSPHWYCPINANKTIVEIWTSKCWSKVNAYNFSAGGVGISGREYDTPSSLYFGIDIVYKISCFFRNLQFLNHVIIVITKALLLNHVIIVITKVILLNHVIIVITKVLLLNHVIIGISKVLLPQIYVTLTDFGYLF